MLDITGDFWVFAYGSLMWDPRFPCRAVRPARLAGYHRALCILSIRNRGTAERPGLVLGLAPGGSCSGRALHVAAADAPSALAHLFERELSTGAYLTKQLPIRLDGGDRVRALAFVARPDHPQYVSGLSAAGQARLVAQGTGPYGTSLAYLQEVVRHLDGCGIAGGPLHRVLALAEGFAAAAAEHPGADAAGIT